MLDDHDACPQYVTMRWHPCSFPVEHTPRALSSVYPGWGDTATILVLSEQLDIDVFLYTPPDTRLSTQDLPNKFRPLLFRKSTHKKAADNRLIIRYHEGHFIYQTRFNDTKTRIGNAAEHEHYLTGTHDVATGRCVQPMNACKLLHYSMYAIRANLYSACGHTRPSEVIVEHCAARGVSLCVGR